MKYSGTLNNTSLLIINKANYIQKRYFIYIVTYH